MEPRPDYKTDSDRRLGRVDGIIHLADDEFRVVNIILHPLGQHDHGEGSLHRVLDSPTRSESSDGSWDPIREFYAIVGGEVPTEQELKQQEDEATLRQAAEAEANTDRHVHEEIVQTKMGDQNVFTTPQ